MVPQEFTSLYRSLMHELDDAMASSSTAPFDQTVLSLATFRAAADALHTRLTYYNQSMQYMHRCVATAEMYIQRYQTTLIRHINADCGASAQQAYDCLVEVKQLQALQTEIDQRLAATVDELEQSRAQCSELDSRLTTLTETNTQQTADLAQCHSQHLSD